MRREGDRVIFDSEEQQEEFERRIQRGEIGAKLLEQIVDAITGARMDATRCWAEVERQINLGPDEVLTYDWRKRELQVRQRGT